MNLSTSDKVLPISVVRCNEITHCLNFSEKYINGSFHEEDSDFDDPFDSPTLRAVTLIIYFLVMPIGCLLHFLVIHYEQFGGDPQKRSLYNRIIAYISALEILHAIVVEHIFVARVFLGCLPSEIGTFNWFCKNLKNSILVTLITITLSYRTMRVYNFRQIAGLNDNALSIFILLATFMNNFSYMTIRYMFGEGENNIGFNIMTCGQGGKNIDFDERFVPRSYNVMHLIYFFNYFSIQE